MCGRFTLRQKLEELARAFNLSAKPKQLPLRYNISPTQQVPVIRQTPQGRELVMMAWGLIPAWSKEPKMSYSTINAKSEEAATKPAFRSAMKKRRCLIPADGFYEWVTKGKEKLPQHIHRPDGQPFAFAGLWERWDKAEPAVESCTILTTPAADWFKWLHTRMPVILSPNDYDAWLNPEETDPAKLAYMFEAAQEGELIVTPANPVVNNARHEGADCLDKPAK